MKEAQRMTQNVLRLPYKRENWFVTQSVVWADDSHSTVRPRVMFSVFCDDRIVEWEVGGPLHTFWIGNGDDQHWSGATGVANCGQHIVDELSLQDAAVRGWWEGIFHRIESYSQTAIAMVEPPRIPV